MTPMRHFLLPLALLCAVLPRLASAQYELTSGNFNAIYSQPTSIPTAPGAATAPTAGQYASIGAASSFSGPVVPANVTTPSAAPSSAPASLYPSNGSVVLLQSALGAGFATDVPRYKLGEIIPPPLYTPDLALLPPDSDFWRPDPVRPGEAVNGTVLIPTGQVIVTQASANSNIVTLKAGEPLPPQLVVGAYLLGQQITIISGNTITLAANSKETIQSDLVSEVIPAERFYFSPHEGSPDRPGTPSRAVYASSSGAVSIIWVSRQPQGGVFTTLEESFTVSSKSDRPIRTMYWSEGTFGAPQVQISDSRIERVTIAYNRSVPQGVATESGVSNGTANFSTLSFEKRSGVGYLKAYNVEGTVLIDYLQTSQAGGGAYYSLGTELVRLVRTATPFFPTVHLGQEIRPHDGDNSLTPEPVGQSGTEYYAMVPRPDGSTAFFAEEATSPANEPDNGKPANTDAYSNKVAFYWMEAGDFGIRWPKYLDLYWLRWSPNLADYVHYTVDSTGSTPQNGISFGGGLLPDIASQDDPAGDEAKLDTNTQRFYVQLKADKKNRALLKFNAGEGFPWYLPVYTQAEDRALTLSTTTADVGGETVHTTASTAGLEAGMVVSGPGIVGTVTVVRIISATQFVTSGGILPGGSYTFDVESDGAAQLNLGATVGNRIDPPAGHELAGEISAGTCYNPLAYLNPLNVGAASAAAGAIIPVNARPGANTLKVRWFKRVPSPRSEFADLYFPGKVGTYTVTYPASTTPQIVLASGVGTDDLAAPLSSGVIYYQNDPAGVGFNPNEEHAVMLGGRAYALRDDLNVTSGAGYTSESFVLVSYMENSRPNMKAFKVVRTVDTGTIGVEDQPGDILFDYNATAGTLLVKPYPLPLLPPPTTGSGASLVSKDIEIVGADNPTNSTFTSDSTYSGFTFKDRKGFVWVHRGPHNGGTPTLTMKLYYKLQAGFYMPGFGTQPAVGTIVPYLRSNGRSGTTLVLNDIDNGETDEPLPIVYRPVWPAQVPELAVAETLTLPKFGLPQVRGQVSAQVLYQQSIAKAASGSTARSVVLHDSTREKTIELPTQISLTKLRSSFPITEHLGKIYFQGLSPDLQQRFFVDPLRGARGTLVLQGEFVDVIAGEDYLNLNMLTAAQTTAVKNLLAASDADRSTWNSTIDGLKTAVETFKENPNISGNWIPDTTKTVLRTAYQMAEVDNVEVAVDSYAVTATGTGEGYVTMVFGNGKAFTPDGDPVQVKVFRVVPRLYVGDLKAIYSSNPFDEQVTLRHSGDFAGKPEDYDYEWRWTTGAATAPAVYAITMQTRIPTNANWLKAEDPGAMLPASYSGAPSPMPTVANVRPATYSAEDVTAGYPSVVFKSVDGVNFSTGVPGTIVFSANVGAEDGFILYVNGNAALGYKAPEAVIASTIASTGLSAEAAPLPLQFNVPPAYFTNGLNTVEVAIYSTSDLGTQSGLEFRLEAALETDVVTANGSVWQSASPGNTNLAIVGGSVTNPFGGPQFVLNDRWFTMRYKPKTGNVAGTGFSRWMPPMLVEGWVKRVLDGINPFEQRVKELTSGVNTDVSVITQAGTRWEGDIALTLSNVNDVGLIEIYETVLNRAKSMSIDANTNDPDTNNALLLAAGYLNDLYTLLGNEAYADAANPTISIDDEGSATLVNTSRFAFESQVASSLDEELALLRGRNDDVSPGVRTAPAYNRLYWNFTRGINSGEAIYALNYNIKEKVGSSTADGVIDAADAQRMFPQGHGDAYGHYLTALKSYYKLLTNPNFTWSPRAEAITILGQPVTVDYQDERKFAAAANNIARSAQQILALTWRQTYRDDPARGWSHFRDSKATNTQTGIKSAQGLDEWGSRSGQGAFFHWVVGNAMVPDVDENNTGVQKIDRTTVLELRELAGAAQAIQTAIDNANAHLNPLGLSPGAIAFDIEPYFNNSLGSELTNPDLVSKGHYEQIAIRALNSLNNAAGAFNQAASMSGALRNQEMGVDEFNTAIIEQERAFERELISIYGKPYSEEVGAGKLYPQGYTGPDLKHWYIVDRPTSMVDTSKPVSITVYEDRNIAAFTTNKVSDILTALTKADSVTGGGSTGATQNIHVYTATVHPSQFVQYNDTWKPGGLGNRAETGALQEALLDAQVTYLALSDKATILNKERFALREAITVFNGMVEMHQNSLSEKKKRHDIEIGLASAKLALETISALLSAQAGLVKSIADAGGDSIPTVVGLANDVTAPVRGAIKLTGATAASILLFLDAAKTAVVGAFDIGITRNAQDLERELDRLGFNQEEIAVAMEIHSSYRESVTRTEEIMGQLLEHQRALQNVNNILSQGIHVQEELQLFRQRAASVIQGYRTRDVTFRLFRNEALEQYRTLFDLASRYTYLAAKSYDYELGLLGTSEGEALFNQIVASRALGDLTDGTPRLTTSTLGDGGLANVMARLNADFSVAESRFGLNNPDHNNTVFSMRNELFRIIDDETWRQTLEQHMVSNLMTDPDAAKLCRNLKKSDGTPVPGIVIPFSTSIQQGRNFFGLELAGGDHAYSTSTFATKIGAVGIALPGYVGIEGWESAYQDASLTPAEQQAVINAAQANILSATPYVYLIPVGTDYMQAPPMGGGSAIRSWTVHDQAMPLPFNLGANDFNATQFFSANGTLREAPWIIRQHQAFRAVADSEMFLTDMPLIFTNARLIARSAWNSRWKIVIPAHGLLSNEQAALNRFAASVKDVHLFLRTYSHSGN